MGQVVDLPTRRRKAPIAVNGKVAPPRRRANREVRSRELAVDGRAGVLAEIERLAGPGDPITPGGASGNRATVR